MKSITVPVLWKKQYYSRHKGPSPCDDDKKPGLPLMQWEALGGFKQAPIQPLTVMERCGGPGRTGQEKGELGRLRKWEVSGCHGVAMLGWKNWEEPFGRSLGSYLLPKKSGA